MGSAASAGERRKNVPTGNRNGSHAALQDGTLLVSVVIPAYNSARYIAATLDSVFAQSVLGYEVLVVNDGSPETDSLESALEPYQSKIRYFKQENRGPSAARNLAIQAARGKYVAFLDSDDLWMPLHLQKQVEFLEEHPQYGLAYANGVVLRGDAPVGILFETTPQSSPTDFDGLLHERSTVITSSAVVSRQALLRVGLFDEHLRRCEDYDLWLRLSHAGFGLSFTRELQICHRLGNGLASSNELMKRALIQVYEKHLALGTLNASQAHFVRKKIDKLVAAIEYRRAKQALLGGEFLEALEGMEKAETSMPSLKLKFARIGLRFFPRMFQYIYRFHVQRVERQYRARGARSLRDAGFEGLATAERVERTQLSR